MLTANEARKRWSYEPETGILRWNNPTSNRLKPGDVAGSPSTTRTKTYIRIGVKGKLLLAHRIIFLIVTGSWPDDKVDHIDGDGTNNRWNNLRHATILENSKNKSLCSNNRSGFNGVYWCNTHKKWAAVITASGKRKHLGFFDEKSGAIAARENANRTFGFHENHGLIRTPSSPGISVQAMPS